MNFHGTSTCLFWALESKEVEDDRWAPQSCLCCSIICLRNGINSLPMSFHGISVGFSFSTRVVSIDQFNLLRGFSMVYHIFMSKCMTFNKFQDYLKSVPTVESRGYKLRGHTAWGKAQVFSKEGSPTASLRLLPWGVYRPSVAGVGREDRNLDFYVRSPQFFGFFLKAISVNCFNFFFSDSHWSWAFPICLSTRYISSFGKTLFMGGIVLNLEFEKYSDARNKDRN